MEGGPCKLTFWRNNNKQQNMKLQQNDILKFWNYVCLYILNLTIRPFKAAAILSLPQWITRKTVFAQKCKQQNTEELEKCPAYSPLTPFIDVTQMEG